MFCGFVSSGYICITCMTCSSGKMLLKWYCKWRRWSWLILGAIGAGDVAATTPALLPIGVATELCCNHKCGSDVDDGGEQFCHACVESGAEAIRVTFCILIKKRNNKHGKQSVSILCTLWTLCNALYNYLLDVDSIDWICDYVRYLRLALAPLFYAHQPCFAEASVVLHLLVDFDRFSDRIRPDSVIIDDAISDADLLLRRVISVAVTTVLPVAVASDSHWHAQNVA